MYVYIYIFTLCYILANSTQRDVSLEEKYVLRVDVTEYLKFADGCN